MKLLGNIIWFLTGGWLLFLAYLVAAIVFFPMFLPLWRLALYALWPFGSDVIAQADLARFRQLRGLPEQEPGGAGQTVGALGNVLWILTFGWLLALMHLMASFANLCMIFLIVTIPNIVAHWKLMPVAFMPFNRVIVPSELGQEVRQALARDRLGV